MVDNAKKSGKEGNISEEKIRAIIGWLEKVEAGNYSEKLELGDGNQAQKELQDKINALVGALHRQSEEYHATTMEMAMGLSEIFSTLAEVQNGNLDVLVGDETLNSSYEVLANLGLALNNTVYDFKCQLDTIKKQQIAIHELSTPILQIWDNVLALPVIGVVDTRRSVEIMEKLLGEIVNKQVQYVILDITGVEIVDTKTADHFIKVIKSAKLLGANCILTGIRPAVAQTLVEIGVDLSEIKTLRNLQAGLRECLRDMEQKDLRRAERINQKLKKDA